MKFDNLYDVYAEQLKDMYSAEKQLTEALPKMMEAASATELKNAFRNHLEQTQSQLERVRQILDEMDVNPGNKVCVAMEGLIKEADHMVKKEGDSDARDAALICAAQKVEHYEIATYGSLRTWANLLGRTHTADVLQTILDEEYDADNHLDKLAQRHLNEQAIN